MRALGARGLPQTIAFHGRTYRLTREVKHDFFAGTGFYEADEGQRIVLKAGRNHDFLGVPLTWLGRWLRDREMRFYHRLRDLPNIPDVLGTFGETGFLLEFVSGTPLRKDTVVPDRFFGEARKLVAQIHARGIAYVDMNKKANLIIGEDGRPHLVDFQISWDLHELGDNVITRAILRWLQQEDWYHIAKHHSRFRPDELTPEEREAGERRSVLIRLHRFITKPWFGIRRQTWKRLRATGRLLPEGSE
jgi:hypothetical protein